MFTNLKNGKSRIFQKNLLLTRMKSYLPRVPLINLLLVSLMNKNIKLYQILIMINENYIINYENYFTYFGIIFKKVDN